MKPTLLILAAGRGSRFGGAKQVNPMGPNGETIMEYSIYDALKNGFGKVVLVINEEVREDIVAIAQKLHLSKEQMALAYQDRYMGHISKELNAQREKPWGTGHAILCAEEHIKTPFAMINADDFYGREAFGTMATFLTGTGSNDQSKYSMVGYDLVNTLSENGTVSRGVSMSDKNGYLTSITETHGIHAKDGQIVYVNNDGVEKSLNEGLASMNFWGFQTSLFDELHKKFKEFLSNTPYPNKDEFVIPSVIDDMIHQKTITVSVLHSPAKWFGVTYKEDKPWVMNKLQEFVDKKIYPSPLTL